MVKGSPVLGTTLGILKRMLLDASVGMNPPPPSHVKKSSQMFTVRSVEQRNNYNVLVFQAMKSSDHRHVSLYRMRCSMAATLIPKTIRICVAAKNKL